MKRIYEYLKSTFAWMQAEESKFALGLAAIGIVIGLLFLLLRASKTVPDADKLDGQVISFVLGAVMSIFFTSLRVIYKVNEASKSIAQARGEIGASIVSTHGDVLALRATELERSADFKRRNDISKFDGIAKDCSLDLIDYVTNIVRTDDRTLWVGTDNLGVVFNTKFWERLRAYQEALDKQPDKQTIVVDLTHTTTIDFWFREDAFQSLRAQKEFRDAGGQINRIITGPFSQHEIELGQMDAGGDIKEFEKYVDRIRDMTDHYRINVLYINQEPVRDGGSQDFAIVRMPGGDRHRDIAMVWKLTKTVIVECYLVIDGNGDAEGFPRILSNHFSMGQLRDLWDMLYGEYRRQTRKRQSF